MSKIYVWKKSLKIDTIFSKVFIELKIVVVISDFHKFFRIFFDLALIIFLGFVPSHITYLFIFRPVELPIFGVFKLSIQFCILESSWDFIELLMVAEICLIFTLITILIIIYPQTKAIKVILGANELTFRQLLFL